MSDAPGPRSASAPVASDDVAHAYDASYQDVDSPLMRQIRSEAYGEDVGQHSWVTADELRADASRLALGPSRQLLDLGCGPCGPLTFLVATTGCHGVGIELSAPAVRAGRARASALGIEGRFEALVGDLNAPLAFDASSFHAVLSVDAVLHVRDRVALFREVARTLGPCGRFLFTDAGVVTGPASNEDLQRRSAHGYTQFVPPGWNERALEAAGLALVATEDRSEGVVRNARGRLEATRRHRDALSREWSAAWVDRQIDYLAATLALVERRALSRFMYLAEKRAA